MIKQKQNHSMITFWKLLRYFTKQVLCMWVKFFNCKETKNSHIQRISSSDITNFLVSGKRNFSISAKVSSILCIINSWITSHWSSKNCRWSMQSLRERTPQKKMRPNTGWTWLGTKMQEIKLPGSDNLRFKLLFRVADIVLMKFQSSAGKWWVYYLMNKNIPEASDKNHYCLFLA